MKMIKNNFYIRKLLMNPAVISIRNIYRYNF